MAVVDIPAVVVDIVENELRTVVLTVVVDKEATVEDTVEDSEPAFVGKRVKTKSP